MAYEDARHRRLEAHLRLGIPPGSMDTTCAALGPDCLRRPHDAFPDEGIFQPHYMPAKDISVPNISAQLTLPDTAGIVVWLQPADTSIYDIGHAYSLGPTINESSMVTLYDSGLTIPRTDSPLTKELRRLEHYKRQGYETHLFVMKKGENWDIGTI